MTNPHFNDDYYLQMWTRFPPYLIGILLGWMLHQTRRSKVVMSKVSNYKFHFIRNIKRLIITIACVSVVFSHCWMGLSNCHWIGNYLRINSLLGRNASSRDEFIRPRLLRLSPSSRLVHRRRLAHLCPRSRLRRTRQSVPFLEGLCTSQSTHLHRLPAACQLHVHVVEHFAKTDLLHGPESRSVLLGRHLWLKLTRLWHFGDS